MRLLHSFSKYLTSGAVSQQAPLSHRDVAVNRTAKVPAPGEFSANDSLHPWVSRRSWTPVWIGGLRGRGKRSRPPTVDVDTGTSKSRLQQTIDLETRNWNWGLDPNSRSGSAEKVWKAQTGEARGEAGGEALNGVPTTEPMGGEGTAYSCESGW